MCRGKGLLLLAVCAAALLVPATSQAAGPMDLAVSHFQRYISATWTHPGRTNSFIEISNQAPLPDQTFPPGAAVQEDLVAATADPTTYDSPVQRPEGDYWVRVAVTDPLCGTCSPEYSNVAFVRLPPAPTNLVVTQRSRIVTATWQLPTPQWFTDELQFSPALGTDPPPIDKNGNFVDDYNPVPLELFPELFPDETTFDSIDPIPPGSYWVHVSGYDASCTSACDPSQVSSAVRLVIPPDPVIAPPAPRVVPPVVTDKVTSFSSLKCSSTQKASKLTLQVAMPENGTITVGGTVNVPNASKVYKLKAVSVKALAGKTLTVKVKLPKKTLKAVRKALKRRKKVKANLTITARDAAGNTKTEKRSVKLKR